MHPCGRGNRAISDAMGQNLAFWFSPAESQNRTSPLRFLRQRTTRRRQASAGAAVSYLPSGLHEACFCNEQTSDRTFLAENHEQNLWQRSASRTSPLGSFWKRSARRLQHRLVMRELSAFWLFPAWPCNELASDRTLLLGALRQRTTNRTSPFGSLRHQTASSIGWHCDE